MSSVKIMPDTPALDDYLGKTAGALFRLAAEVHGAAQDGRDRARGEGRRHRLRPYRPDAGASGPRFAGTRRSAGRDACSATVPRQSRSLPDRRARGSTERAGGVPRDGAGGVEIGEGACRRRCRREARKAFLPLALVDPYLSALQKVDPLRQIAEINPLYRLWRLATCRFPRRNKRTIHDRGNTTLVLAELASGHKRRCLALPLGVLLAGFLTIYKLWAGNHIEPEDDKILGTLAASFLWVVAVDLFVESQGRTQRARGIAWIAGIAVIALLFHFKWEAWLFPPLLFGSLLFAVGLAGQLRSGERNAAFWLFNHRLWLAAALGLIGAVLFGGGLSIILETLNFLFGLELPQIWHERIWTVALGFLAPVSWLALAPQNFTDRISGEETEFTTRAVATIVKFVLVPLLLVYTAILYAYALKIELAGTLPKGTLGSLVVGYLLAGAATLLVGLSHPRQRRRPGADVLALLGLAHGPAGSAPVSRGLYPHRRLRPHRAALRGRAHRRLGADPCRMAHGEARRKFRSPCDSGVACDLAACGVVRALGHRRRIGAEPDGRTRRYLAREGDARRWQVRASCQGEQLSARQERRPGAPDRILPEHPARASAASHPGSRASSKIRSPKANRRK